MYHNWLRGELLKLGVDIGQTSVAKYMVRRRDPPSQGWTTFRRCSIPWRKRANKPVRMLA